MKLFRYMHSVRVLSSLLYWFAFKFLKHKGQDKLYKALTKLKEGLLLFLSLSLSLSLSRNASHLSWLNSALKIQHAKFFILFAKPDQCAYDVFSFFNRTDASRVHFPSINSLSRFSKSHMHSSLSCIYYASMQEGHCFRQWFRTLL